MSNSVPITCPVCRGTSRDPEANAAIADDDGTCPMCCDPLHPWYAARHGWAQVPTQVLVAAAEAQLCKLGLAGPDTVLDLLDHHVLGP